MTKSHLISNQGFTLMEIVVAIFLIIVALLGIAATTVMVVKNNSISKQMTTATILSQDKLEDIKNLAYSDLSSCPATLSCPACLCTCSDGRSTCTDYASTESVVQYSEPGSFYTRSWTIGPEPNDTSNANIRAITVTVAWLWRNTPHNVTLNTSIAR